MTTRTIQMTIDAELLEEVDQATRMMRTNRSALIRTALAEYLRHARTKQQERQHAEGYARAPQTADEYAPWESEQVWPEA